MESQNKNCSHFHVHSRIPILCSQTASSLSSQLFAFQHWTLKNLGWKVSLVHIVYMYACIYRIIYIWQLVCEWVLFWTDFYATRWLSCKNCFLTENDLKWCESAELLTQMPHLGARNRNSMKFPRVSSVPEGWKIHPSTSDRNAFQLWKVVHQKHGQGWLGQ